MTNNNKCELCAGVPNTTICTCQPDTPREWCKCGLPLGHDFDHTDKGGWEEVFNDQFWAATQGRNDLRVARIRTLLSQERARVGREVLEKMPREQDLAKISPEADIAFTAIRSRNIALSEARKVIEEVCGTNPLKP